MNFNHVSELSIAFLVVGPIFAVLFGVSISSLFLGFTKYDECPFQPFLPQGLIGFGLLASICSIIALILVSTRSLFYQPITTVNTSVMNLKKYSSILYTFSTFETHFMGQNVLEQSELAFSKSIANA